MESIHKYTTGCGRCEPYTGCQDTRANYERKQVYTKPEDSTDEHDLLRNNYDNRNTRMMMTLKNLGFCIKEIGEAYHYMKHHYFTFKEQYRFRPYMNAICNIVENARFYAVQNMAYSAGLRLHKCDFRILAYASTWNVSAHSLDLCTRWKNMSPWAKMGREQPDTEDLNRFAKTFFATFTDGCKAFDFPVSTWKHTYPQTIPEGERPDLSLIVTNKKESWRLLTCTLPAFILTNTRRIIAEQREDDRFHDVEPAFDERTYVAYRDANECIHKIHLAKNRVPKRERD